MIVAIVAISVVVLILLIMVISGIKVVPQASAYVVERLGTTLIPEITIIKRIKTTTEIATIATIIFLHPPFFLQR